MMKGSYNNFEKIQTKKVAIKGIKVEKDKEHKVSRSFARKGKAINKWQV